MSSHILKQMDRELKKKYNPIINNFSVNYLYTVSQNKQCFCLAQRYSNLLSDGKKAEACQGVLVLHLNASLNLRQLGTRKCTQDHTAFPCTRRRSENTSELDVVPGQFTLSWLVPWVKGCSELYSWLYLLPFLSPGLYRGPFRVRI